MRRLTLGNPAAERSDDEIFEGEVTMDEFTERLGPDLLIGYDVKFRRGARTVWHTHDSDQMLIVLSGVGKVATENEELDIRAGDVVLIPKGERHWHGAASGTEMNHLAIMTPGETQVLASH